MKLHPIADDHDADYWARQIRVGAWIATAVTVLGCVRVAAAWEPGQRWWCLPLAAAALSQAAATFLPWNRLVRRQGLREGLILWMIAEIPVLYAFSVADDTGRVLYLPGVMVVVAATAALYPPRWVVALGGLSLAGFLALLTRESQVSATFAIGMSAILAAVVGLGALTAGNRMRQDSRRRTAERRTEILLENASDAVLSMAVDGTVRYASPSVRTLLGHDPDWLTGTRFDCLLHPEDLPRVREWLVTLGASPAGPAARSEMRVRRADGGWIYADVIGAHQSADSDLGAVVLSIRDIGGRRALEEELTRQAFADSLTGLANRALFRDRAAHAVARQQRGGGAVTLLLIDLDDFKMVNDTLGHNAGDQLLVAVAERLGAHVRPSDTLARLGGDEFAILVEDLDDVAVADLAQRVIAAMRQPVHLGTRDVICTMSVGVTTVRAGDSLTDTEELLRDADLAMYAAKKGGRNRYAFFDPAMHEDVLREARNRTELEDALATGQFFVQYQPIVDLPNGQLIGVEALARWQHPREGVLGPDTFIAQAEETGLIVPLGRWVLQQACDQLARWHRNLPAARNLHMSVNVSARQFQDEHLVADVAAAVERAGIDPQSLVLEITESMFLQDADVVMSALEAIRAIGVKVAIDDFGTGYSSLSYLQRIPVDIVKIDRSFVSAEPGQAQYGRIAEAVINISRAFQLRTVAEGIETDEQWATLRDMGCESGQGYLFARPADPADIEALLSPARHATQNANPAVERGAAA